MAEIDIFHQMTDILEPIFSARKQGPIAVLKAFDESAVDEQTFTREQLVEGAQRWVPGITTQQVDLALTVLRKPHKGQNGRDFQFVDFFTDVTRGNYNNRLVLDEPRFSLTPQGADLMAALRRVGSISSEDNIVIAGTSSLQHISDHLTAVVELREPLQVGMIFRYFNDQHDEVKKYASQRAGVILRLRQEYMNNDADADTIARLKEQTTMFSQRLSDLQTDVRDAFGKIYRQVEALVNDPITMSEVRRVFAQNPEIIGFDEELEDLLQIVQTEFNQLTHYLANVGQDAFAAQINGMLGQSAHYAEKAYQSIKSNRMSRRYQRQLSQLSDQAKTLDDRQLTNLMADIFGVDTPAQVAFQPEGTKLVTVNENLDDIPVQEIGQFVMSHFEGRPIQQVVDQSAQEIQPIQWDDDGVDEQLEQAIQDVQALYDLDFNKAPTVVTKAILRTIEKIVSDSGTEEQTRQLREAIDKHESARFNQLAIVPDVYVSQVQAETLIRTGQQLSPLIDITITPDDQSTTLQTTGSLLSLEATFHGLSIMIERSDNHA